MLVVGLAAATALFSGVQALNFQARLNYDQAERQLGGGGLAAYVAPSGAAFDEAAFAALRRRGVLVSPVVEGRVVIGSDAFTVLGIDPATAPRDAAVGGLSAQGDDGPAPATFLTPPYAMLAAPETVRILSGARETAEGAPLPPSREASGIAPFTLVMDIGAAQGLLNKKGALTRLLVVDDAGAPDRIEAAGVDLIRVDVGDAGGAGALTGSFHLNLTAFGFLSFLVGLLIVRSAAGLAFEQRVATLRTMRASGVTTAQLTVAIVCEALAAALIAGGLGVLAGYAVAAVILPDVALTLRGLYGANVSGELVVRPVWVALALAMSVAGALAASAAGVVRLRSLSVLDAAKPHLWMRAAGRAARRDGALAAGACLIALLALMVGDGLIAGFVILGAALLAAALALPPALGWIAARLEAQADGAVARWFWADARQQLPSLALALQALMIALAANIGVGAMVGSFRDTFVGWLDQRLAAEAFIRLGPTVDGDELDGWLAQLPDVVRTLPFGSVSSRINGAPVSLLGFVDDETYRDNWPLLAAADAPWRRVADGEAVLINEQMFRRRNISVGDTLEIMSPAGPWPVVVAGVYSDYGNPAGEAMANIEAVAARWPEFNPRFRQIRLSASDESDAVRRFMQDAISQFDLDEDAIIDQKSLKAFSVSVFERTFSVTAALNVLTLAVSGVAMLTALSALSAARLTMLAPAWAMGLTRDRLAGLDFARTIALSALTAAAAIPVGVVIAWVLTAIVNVEAFGWRLPLRHYPADWARLAAIAIVIAGLASAPSALSLRRASSGDLLKAFSAER